MVSNVLDMTPQQLVEALERFGREYVEDDEYRGLRAALPADWPF